MPSRWFRRAALSSSLLGGGWLVLSCAPTASPPSEPGARPSALAERLSCARVGSDAWSPLPGVEYTGLLVIDLPPAARGAMSLIVGDAIPLEIEARTVAGPFPLTRDRLRVGPGTLIPADLWLEAGGPWSLPRELVRVTVSARAERPESVEIALGRRAPRVLARLLDYPVGVKATACAGRPDARWLRREEALVVAASAAEYFAAGWWTAAPDAHGEPVRWMRQAGAILVPSEESGSVRIQLRAAPPASQPVLTRVSLHVNEVWQGIELAMRPGVAEYEWEVPTHAWVSGVNELLFRASHDAASPERTIDARSLAFHTLRVNATETSAGRR